MHSRELDRGCDKNLIWQESAYFDYISIDNARRAGNVNGEHFNNLNKKWR